MAALLFLIYLPAIGSRALLTANTPFVFLQVLGVFVLPFFSKWLLAALFLGYFFRRIPGSTGLQKGLVVAAGIAAATLPSNVLLLLSASGDPLALLWDVAQTLLFMTILGLLAFDFNTIRRYGRGFNDLLKEQGLAFMLPYLSSLGGAAGGVVASLVTGRVESIIESVVALLDRGASGGLGSS
jgi:hypothetical protein